MFSYLLNFTIMKMYRWIPGRQSNCLYYKWCFLFARIGRWGFDGYLLKYPDESVLPKHTDKVDGKIWRMNITLSGVSTFYCAKQVLRLGPIHIFRPDLYEHSLLVFKRTYKLSIGIAKFNRNDSITR